MSEIKSSMGEVESGQVPQGQILRQWKTLGQTRLLTLVYQLLHLRVQTEICRTYSIFLAEQKMLLRKQKCSLTEPFFLLLFLILRLTGIKVSGIFDADQSPVTCCHLGAG